MRSRTRMVGTVVVLLNVPVITALVEAVSFYAANRSNRTMLSSGLMREYHLYVPGSYDPTRPTPLVISMHGAALWPTAQRDISQWNRMADAHGFLVVYPSGVAGRGPRVWDMDAAGLAGDVRFIADLLDTLGATYNLDRTRIYADGLSNGGGMAFVLSCTLDDRIAAVGMVGSAQLLPWSWCRSEQAVPMIAFHGTADNAAPYHGGSSWVVPNRTLPSLVTWTANWARRNRCAPVPRDTVVAPDVTRRTYGDCANRADVVLYTVHGGGHTWPGASKMPEWFVGSTSGSIDATAEMWAFFRRHRLGQ